jgi:hypothetical protein
MKPRGLQSLHPLAKWLVKPGVAGGLKKISQATFVVHPRNSINGKSGSKPDRIPPADSFSLQ